MPGLVGFVGEPADSKSEALLANMAQALKHEDWYRVELYQEEGLGLGRVSLGLSNPEPQPIWNEDETLCLVMEGEIYDYEDLKQRLIANGHRFQVNNDAEFVLHLFEELGEEFASYLNGAFVAAIWDRQAKELILVNDRFGLRPLYYAQHNGGLIFASGMRALLCDPRFHRRINPLAVAQLLSFEYVLGNRTLLTEAHLLPPSTLLTFGNGRLVIRSYWTLEFHDFCQPLGEEKYLEGFVHYMRQAVTRQAHDSLPAGVLLSGGLDSRMIVAFLCDDLVTEPLHTFTFGIPDCDDVRLAQEVAALLGTRHLFSELKPNYLLDAGDEGVRLTDGMMSCVHMHAYANLRAQSQHASALYMGFMGDALLGGHLNRQLWAGFDEDALHQLMFEDACVLFSPAEQKKLFADHFQNHIKDDVFDSFRAVFAESKANLVANRQNHFDLRQRQRRFILNGVELVRSQVVVHTPFCDNDLVEFMLTVPPGLRLDRFLMVQAFIRFFPAVAKVPYARTGLPLMACARDLLIRINRLIRWRLHRVGLKRSPFPQHRRYCDYNSWMRTALRSWVEEILLSEHTLERGYFNPNYIRQLVAEHMAGADHNRKLGMLITLERWHRQFLD